MVSINSRYLELGESLNYELLIECRSGVEESEKWEKWKRAYIDLNPFLISWVQLRHRVAQQTYHQQIGSFLGVVHAISFDHSDMSEYEIVEYVLIYTTIHQVTHNSSVDSHALQCYSYFKCDCIKGTYVKTNKAGENQYLLIFCLIFLGVIIELRRR